MLQLVMEVVKNYDVDGVQGDDRLPAMPSESGYDPYTVGLYKEQHNGAEPPHNFKDSAWIQWRADILNRYMERIHASVKAVKPSMLIAMSPSVYPWSKEEYLQDWPTWVNKGYVDLVIPQIYRYTVDRYIETIDEMLVSQIDKDKLNRVTPGILLKVGKYYPTKKMLDQMIKENRKRGIKGEVFFFYEGLKKYPEYFETLYKDTVEFPSFPQ
jgi:uncharacterized lipoprotein YddW (UPF0748 family)